jgi:glyoxalase/bleomycin resistance protein/dioxygenase superfamily protein
MDGDRIAFDHIAIALERIADAPPVLVGALGGLPDSAAPSREFNRASWRFDGGGQIEVLEPAREDGFLRRFLRQRGPGVHHVTFKVPSLRDACDRAEAHGYEIVGYDDSWPGWKEAFLHPRQALGLVVQFAEASGRDAPRFRMPLPPGPPAPPPPLTVVGLRTRARSAERARTQWERVLLGEPADGGLVYRWVGSPMRIAVEIDPDAEEGAMGIEIQSHRPVSLPGRPLGVAWLATP